MSYLIHYKENFEKGAGNDVYWFNGYGSKLIKNLKTEKGAWNFALRKVRQEAKSFVSGGR